MSRKASPTSLGEGEIACPSRRCHDGRRKCRPRRAARRDGAARNTRPPISCICRTSPRRCASQAAFMPGMEIRARRDGVSLRCASKVGLRSAPPPNQLSVVTIMRVFICTAGTCGFCICAIRLMPLAQKRGSSLRAFHLLGEFGREGAMHGGDMHAHFLEQPAPHHAHHAAALVLAVGREGARQGVRTKRPASPG